MTTYNSDNNRSVYSYLIKAVLSLCYKIDTGLWKSIKNWEGTTTTHLTINCFKYWVGQGYIYYNRLPLITSYLLDIDLAL